MTEEGAVKCKVCGRVLHNPVSIARGIGPVCAGDGSGGRSIRVKIRNPSHRDASSNQPLPIQILPQVTVNVPNEDQLYRLVTTPLRHGQFRAALASMKRGTKKKLQRLRGEMLLARRTFCAGAFFMNEEQCMYEPVNEDSWREVHSPRVIRSFDLESYLNRIGVIATERKLTQQQHISNTFCEW